MAQNSTIEWTDASWNPVRGCTKISPGCKNCYAYRIAERFRGVKGNAYEQGFDLRLVPSHLNDPILWEKPKKIFVNSMSDLFHEGVSDDYIVRVCKVMAAANWHQFQVLTKRADRMHELLSGKLGFAARLDHILWGVSAENRQHGLPRIEKLRFSTAKMRFLSLEPLIEDLGQLNLSGIDWVIVGGESGPGARPIDPEWVRSIKDQCRAAGIPFFFKQWGGANKKKAGCLLDGESYGEHPVVHCQPVPDRKLRRVLADGLA